MRPMRLIMLMSILAVLVVPALAIAAGEGMGGGDMGAGGMAGQEKQAEGTISSIDEQNMTMQVEPAPGQAPMTLSFGDDTQVMGPQGAKMSWNELKEGDRIRASYMKKDGKDHASKIEVMPSAGAGGAMQPQGGGMQQQGGGM